MAAAHIDFWFTTGSMYSYLSVMRLGEVERASGTRCASACADCAAPWHCSKVFLGDTQSERIKSELKWLTAELAPARDLDVYERSKIEPLRTVLPGKTGMKELAETLASRRAAAFNRAKAAVDWPRYHSLLLNTLQWLENGDWAKHRRRQSGPIERFATKVLARRTKKAKKKRGSCANSIPDSVMAFFFFDLLNRVRTAHPGTSVNATFE